MFHAVWVVLKYIVSEKTFGLAQGISKYNEFQISDLNLTCLSERQP